MKEITHDHIRRMPVQGGTVFGSRCTPCCEALLVPPLPIPECGNGMISVCFRSDSFSAQGNVSWHESTADSGNRMQRGFCPSCGTPLFSKAEARPHLIFIRAGALDNPNLMGPQTTI